ncbi:hypothetical protein amrb99_07100 [Actinomadura sp. RB99]|uniref:hypothetical protein n=1 Tax=Actinomadura sp. RB99 TaxID=2691577 RepID=UPI0016846DEA|nr:hypothetical protein [Actinomadura sp. RB99]MBD2891803.1 hypothetical protein [Actinomadura sp. RB99]
MDPIAAASLAVSIVGTALSTTISIAAWRAAHRSATAGHTASQIELDRRHEELTPQFTLTARRDTFGSVKLWIELTAPSALGGLDYVCASIRDEGPARPWRPRPPTFDVYRSLEFQVRDRDEVILADYVFNTGRISYSFALQVGESQDIYMVRTSPPVGWRSTAEEWRLDRARHPLVVELECYKGGWAPWTVAVTVTFPDEEPQG